MKSTTNLRESIGIKSRVYNALILRFIITKYGRNDLGFVWVLIEPMILCVGVIITWSIIKGGKEHGLQIAWIVFTGYMPLTLWRHMSNSAAFILRSNRSIVHFRNIKYLDVIFSRLILELISVSAAAAIVYVVLYQLGVLTEIYDLSLVFEGWIIMGGIGFGGGLLIAAATESSAVTEKFIPPLQYLLLPFSGCFFMLDWLPNSSREIIIWMPFVHSFETIRAGVFGPIVNTYGNTPYALAWAVGLTACGLLWVQRVQDHLEP